MHYKLKVIMKLNPMNINCLNININLIINKIYANNLNGH